MRWRIVPENRGGMSSMKEILEAQAAFCVWMIAFAALYTGVVDTMILFLCPECWTVSDTIWWVVNRYPPVGWFAAGLVFHLLVGTPVPRQH